MKGHKAVVLVYVLGDCSGSFSDARLNFLGVRKVPKVAIAREVFSVSFGEITD